MRTKIYAYVKERYNTDPEFLWTKNPEYAVLRHRHNKKWYAVLMNVEKEKLGLKQAGQVWIIDVKVTADTIENIPESPGFFPGYHMNKKYWISILLDGSVKESVLKKFIDLSYELTQTKK